MKTKFIEAMHVNGDGNWGKFMVARFEEREWNRHSEVLCDEYPAQAGSVGTYLLGSIGWSRRDIVVFDLQTGEGARFRASGSASADLNKHKVWVCPLFEPFLSWLYKQDLTDLDKLPAKVEFTEKEAEFALAGYRRKGKAK
jgi:hypothetical protein